MRPRGPRLVPAAVRPTPWALASGDVLGSAGFPVREDAVLTVAPDASGPAAVVVVSDAARGLAAVRAGALDALIWPCDADALGAVLAGALERLEEQVRLRAVDAAWRKGTDWSEITDGDARLVDVNVGFERTSGYSAGDAIGKTPAQLFRAGTHGPAFYATAHDRAMQGGWDGEFVARRRDGSWCVQDVHIAAVVLGDRPVAMFANKRAALEPGQSALSALLARRAVEPWLLARPDGAVVEQSVAARDALGPCSLLGDVGLGDLPFPAVDAALDGVRVVGERVFDVRSFGLRVGDVPLGLFVLHDVTELARARDSANDANQAKSAFLAGMSHELRTPLNAILGYAELVRDTVDDPETLADLARIHLAGTHLLALVDDVLDLARVESGRLELELAPLDLGGLAREVADTLRHKAEQRGQHIELQCEAVSVLSDARRVRQIVVNLLGNATKHAVPGRVVVGTRGGPSPALWVEDEGPGLSAAQAARLFQPYTQLGRDVGGVGLGLAISRGLADVLGLALRVETAPGRPTRFTLSF